MISINRIKSCWFQFQDQECLKRREPDWAHVKRIVEEATNMGLSFSEHISAAIAMVATAQSRSSEFELLDKMGYREDIRSGVITVEDALMSLVLHFAGQC